MTQLGQSKVYRKQGSTELTIDAGGYLNAASGKVLMPGVLARGYSTLVPYAAKTTATASGLVVTFTTGTQPSLKTFEIASGPIVFTWVSGAGNDNPLLMAPWRVPEDLSTADPLRVYYNAKNTSGATHDCAILVRANGTATANVGTTGPLTTNPVTRYISVASGSVPASGTINVAFRPTSNASGGVSLYSMGISYAKKTS